MDPKTPTTPACNSKSGGGDGGTWALFFRSAAPNNMLRWKKWFWRFECVSCFPESQLDLKVNSWGDAYVRETIRWKPSQEFQVDTEPLRVGSLEQLLINYINCPWMRKRNIRCFSVRILVLLDDSMRFRGLPSLRWRNTKMSTKQRCSKLLSCENNSTHNTHVSLGMSHIELRYFMWYLSVLFTCNSWGPHT